MVKYLTPEMEIMAVDTDDIILASVEDGSQGGESQGGVTSGGGIIGSDDEL